jgi:hypothetical protein
MKCLTCNKEFSDSDTPAAGFSASPDGDDWTFNFFYCNICKVYTVREGYDRFLGDEYEISFFSEDKEKGAHVIELIHACPEPRNKHCDCPSHKALMNWRWGLPL